MSNDNDRAAAGGPGPDPHGEAALLLVESLIHGLMERSLLTVAQSVEIVATAADVAAETGARHAEATPPPRQPLTLLTTIRESLAIDLARE